MMENGQWQPGPKPGEDKDKKNDGSGLGALIRAIFGGGKANRLPPWATQRPTSTQQLQRQLSGNAGQTPMPGGAVGAIQTGPLGRQGQPSARVLHGMKDYGKGGEATFFAQSTRGGMAPLAALGTLGRPMQWNPFDDWVRKTLGGNDDKDKPKPKGGDKDKPNGYTRPGLDDMGGR